MKSLLLILAGFILMNHCYAEKEIEIYRMRKDSTYKIFRLKENIMVTLKISKPNGEFRDLQGKIKQVTDSFIIIHNQQVYYDNIEAITYRTSEKKHIVQKIIAGALGIPLIASAGITAFGVYYLANKQIFYSSNNPNYSWDPMWGMIVVLGGTAGCIGTGILLGFDLMFDTHFSIYKLRPFESQGNHRWFIRVVEAHKK
jgi:hypothetical protein